MNITVRCSCEAVPMPLTVNPVLQYYCHCDDCTTANSCMAKGVTRVELEARADHIAAIKLYEKSGFLHEGRKRNALRFEGVYYDSVQMTLLYE
jgi:hypothetical protein